MIIPQVSLGGVCRTCPSKRIRGSSKGVWRESWRMKQWQSPHRPASDSSRALACICKHPAFPPSSFQLQLLSWFWVYRRAQVPLTGYSLTTVTPPPFQPSLSVSALHCLGFYTEVCCFEGIFFHFCTLSSPWESLPWESKVGPQGN